MNPDDEPEDPLGPSRGLLIGCAVILAFWVVVIGTVFKIWH